MKVKELINALHKIKNKDIQIILRQFPAGECQLHKVIYKKDENKAIIL